MKVVTKIVIILIAVLLILWVLIFKTPVGHFLNDSGTGLENMNKESLRLMGFIVMLNLSVIFGILGYIVSWQKDRSRWKWTLLCVLFNFWAFLVLTFLPSKKA